MLETKRFDFDDLAKVVDLDGDGFQELGFWTTTFDYFGVCYACSPKPMAWFRYNAATQRYEPANETLFPYLKARYEKNLRGLSTLEQYLTDHISDSYMRGDVMEIVLNYLYAGRDAEAWAIHKKRNTFEDQAGNRVNIKQRLASDPFYRELRARRKRDGR